VKEGRLTRVEGPVSNMGRLDCKEASLIAFDALRHDADAFVTVSDEQSGAAAERLLNYGLETTPSGSAGLAALCDFPLPPDSRCLVLVSEGPEETGAHG
jgi:diaminopropionate ammonia-lyase